ncbi:MAG: hypothetical protein ACPGXL_01235 [Chitinophagales bacterium]
MTFNLEILQAHTMTLSTNQMIYSGYAPTELSVTTTSTDIQWQMGTTNCTTGFTYIVGATSVTYQPPTPTTTAYYRAIIKN